ncbi:ROK family transcriptional regulator [Cellulomonas sp. McL0617]|uniref:ROK family transcriptional regulator n=1 Tax=Cellulomonas sp. McL0617 TaxID=3415675 RepID=UPI003CFB2460
MRRGTNLPAVGGFNQTVVLDLIRRTPDGLSRVEIAEITGLVPQTVSNVARRLLDDGLVIEAGKHIQGRGKPRVILRLDAASRYAVGVHLDPTVITYVVLDLRGQVVAHERARTPAGTDPEETVRTIARSIDAVVAGAGISREKLLGIGIATPGPIDSVRGRVVDPPLLEHWRDVPLRDSVAEASGLSVILEKDVTAAVVAELWTNDTGSDDFAFFYLGTGIGIGMAIGGEAFRGTSGNAGEGGTLVVPGAGLPERRRSEMLGHLATPQFLVAQAVDEGVLPHEPPEHDLAAIDDAFSALVQLADAGDVGAGAILDRAATFIASGLVSVVNLLDFDEIVFGGPAWARVADRMRDEIGRLVATSPDRKTRHEVRLADSSIGEDVAAVGAACLVLDTALSPRTSALLISG